jgi:hypothetical protein
LKWFSPEITKFSTLPCPFAWLFCVLATIKALGPLGSLEN